MDNKNEIRNSYASEAKTYRDDALIINFDATKLFEIFIDIINSFYPNINEEFSRRTSK